MRYFGLLLIVVLAACAPAPTPTLTPVPSITPTVFQTAAPATDRYAGLPQAATALGFPQLGFPSAPVSLVVYSGFDCADCLTFYNETLPSVLQRIRNGEALLTFVPLFDAQGTGNGETAARAALCAGEQGAFWDYHDYLFGLANSGATEYTSDTLVAGVTTLGLDRTAWDSCMLSARTNATLTSARNSLNAQFADASAITSSVLAVFANNRNIPFDTASVTAGINMEAARVNAAVEAALSAADTPDPALTPDALSTAPVVVTLNPLQGQPIPPPITLDLPDGWGSGNDILVLNDVTGIQSIPFSVYTGPLAGGTGTIVLLWAFPSLVAGNPLDTSAVQVDTFTDGVRLLRLAVIEQGCNIGVFDQRDYTVGGLAAVGAPFSAVTCPATPDTQGWFAGLRFNEVGFIFYAFVDPIDSFSNARPQLQAILDSVRFVTPGSP
jgi:protein-disulfide isomerase